MDADSLIDLLETEGELLASAASIGGPDAPVPSAPGWTVRDAVVHTGGVHRWAADIVRHGRDSPDTEAGRSVGTEPDARDLEGWFREGHADLVAALRDAPAELTALTFLPADSPRHFWSRRQAHETAIHRIDVEAAVGRDLTVFAPDFAQDGIAEMLEGFGRRRANRVETDATLLLTATDGPSWTVRFGGERTEAEIVTTQVEADATVRGKSGDLYQWLWNRPAEVAVAGDTDVAALWAATVRVSWA